METDGQRVKRLMGDRNKAKFARDFGLPGGASMIGQHIAEIRPVSFDAAVIYARGLGVPLEDVSPSHAAWLRSVTATTPTSMGPLTDPATMAPSLDQALPVVLDRLSSAPHRAELKTLLDLVIDTGAPEYRQRLAKLLAEAPHVSDAVKTLEATPSTETADFVRAKSKS